MSSILSFATCPWWKEIPSSCQPSPNYRWQEQLMFRCAAFDRGIKICRTLPLDFLCSAGFLDHRAILLAVMGLTKNACNGICNWCLFQYASQACISFGLPCLPPAPCPLLHMWTQDACPHALSLPPQAQGVLPGHWEVKQPGQGTMLFLLSVTPGTWLRTPQCIFMDEQT